MNLIDVHAHLDWPDIIKQIDDIISRAKEADIKVIIANGIDVKSNRKVLELAEKYEIIKPALGVYPNDSLKLSNEEFDKELEFIEKSKPIAIGEIGLDYKDEVDKKLMKERFAKQIKLAEKLGVPVIVHSRKAEEDVIDILEQHSCKVVMHCFGGKKKLWKRIIDNGWSFSIPGIIVRLNHFQDIVKETPLKQLLTETDAPFLSPFTNVMNEPAFIIENVKKIAEIKEITSEECANQIFMNYQNMFL